MGQQKRSSGNCYDSQRGHSYAIGLYGRKIIDSYTYCKVCNICEQARIKNLTPNKHCCAKNWEGLSTSMDSSAILEICARAPSRGYHIDVVISDDDTTMRAHMKHKKRNLKSNERKVEVNITCKMTPICEIFNALKQNFSLIFQNLSFQQTQHTS